MVYTYFILAVFLVLATVIPLIDHPHWFFRAFDFGKVQFLILQVILLITAFIVLPMNTSMWVMQGLLFACIVYHTTIIVKYTPLYNVDLSHADMEHGDSVTLMSANVYQFNTEYPRFLELVRTVNPDIVLTMESNQGWEKALSVLDADYPHQCKVPLENTYGMHFYTKLKMHKCEVHYFVADDLPSMEMELETKGGVRFVFFGVHPPPPSPTEESTSKERDGELLSVAKKIRKDKKTTIVVGDFNNVAWAKSSILFRKTAELVDPRIGRGLISTFHAKSRVLRFPIDQLYHTKDIFVQELKVLDKFGSDHLPLFCQFYINPMDNKQEELVEEMENGDMQDVNTMIQEGKEEQSDNRKPVAKE